MYNYKIASSTLPMLPIADLQPHSSHGYMASFDTLATSLRINSTSVPGRRPMQHAAHTGRLLTDILPAGLSLALPSEHLFLESENLGTDLTRELLVHGRRWDETLGDRFFDLPLDDWRHSRSERPGDLRRHLGPNEDTLDLSRKGLWSQG